MNRNVCSERRGGAGSGGDTSPPSEEAVERRKSSRGTWGAVPFPVPLPATPCPGPRPREAGPRNSRLREKRTVPVTGPAPVLPVSTPRLRRVHALPFPLLRATRTPGPPARGARDPPPGLDPEGPGRRL